MHSPNQLPHLCFVAPHVFPVLSGLAGSTLIGGAEVQQAIVARRLVARGYKVSMICLNFGQDPVVEIDGIRVVRAFRPNAGIPGIRFISPRITSLWRCMKLVDADIYYQRTAGMITGLVASFCRRYGKKSVFAASGNPNFERNTSRIKYRRDRWLYEFGLRHVDRILAQNREQVELCMRNFGRPSTIVPNCYEPPRISRSAIGREILWVGTIRNLKRPSLFLDLAEALPHFRFKMVGGPEPGDKGMFEAIKTRAAGIPNVKFMGFVPYSRVDEHFDSAALLVNTSESEGFPNTFLQAWSRAIVTVSMVDSGARRNGMPVGHVVSTLDQVKTATSRLMNDEALRRSEGVACKEYFEESHAPGPILDLYERVFAEMAAR